MSTVSPKCQSRVGTVLSLAAASRLHFLYIDLQLRTLLFITPCLLVCCKFPCRSDSWLTHILSGTNLYPVLLRVAPELVIHCCFFFCAARVQWLFHVPFADYTVCIHVLSKRSACRNRQIHVLDSVRTNLHVFLCCFSLLNTNFLRHERAPSRLPQPTFTRTPEEKHKERPPQSTKKRQKRDIRGLTVGRSRWNNNGPLSQHGRGVETVLYVCLVLLVESSTRPHTRIHTHAHTPTIQLDNVAKAHCIDTLN